ncbi:calcium:hydrogen antiporter [Trichosporon asahii var. asahii CBS 2479]|uniref:Vacuolar calcium ion transporter n=1 Tax=Trichosporon asahii var. asahii (strain ATCC 90039 / CBS 2479 / JCM 2466 / KCTC 7840 / NBRC 103889/ NCYC 2677 / UAMH 7654) TaxID=1186058 RepID=J5RDD1_TRIAS|nr:calcium:hydrogen antiporter [Trichosporon asahii var. asahii CBS 2479]EJT52008.1 calcium:hydrogen antiporter [Trichosporon asahii var. asahii CBS 2479]
MPPHESSPLLGANGAPSVERMRFIHSTKYLLLGSWMNALLIAVPLSLYSEHADWPASYRFITSFLAIIPLAKLLGDATEQLSMKMGQTLGGLLNASFGNAVELIVAIVALTQNQLRLVQTSLLGSVLSNLLLVLGMSFFASGFYFHESTFQVTAAQTNHLSNKTGGWFEGAGKSTPSDDPSLPGLLTLSRGTAVLLLLTYLAYLVFQLRTHANLFEAEEDEEETPTMDKWSSAIWLCIVTVVTAFSADVLVHRSHPSPSCEQLVRCVIDVQVGNAAEHVTSVWMACKGKMELTIGVAVGSSIQIAAGMIPLLVIIAWPMNKDLTLDFTTFETIVLFVSVMLVNLLLQDGAYFRFRLFNLADRVFPPLSSSSYTSRPHELPRRCFP